LNEDRSHLVDLVNSDWNAWLVDQCAQMATDLLMNDLFDRFGATAHLAFDPGHVNTATVPELGRVV
jgi:hypothetical protein